MASDKRNTSSVVNVEKEGAPLSNEQNQVIQRAMTLALLCMQQGEVANAQELFNRVLKINSNHVGALMGLASIAIRSEKYGIAYQLTSRAVLAEPENAEAHHGKGSVLTKLNKFELAVISYRNAIEIKPDFAVAHANLGVVLEKLGDYDSAKESYEQAIRYDPRSIRGLNGLGSVYRKRSDLDAAIKFFRLANAADSTNFMLHSNLLMCMASHHQISPESYLEEAVRFGKAVMANAKPFQEWPKLTKSAGQVIRVGFVSADLITHPVAYFLKSFLPEIDRSKLEIIAYSANPLEDETTQELKPLFSEWYSIFGLSDAAVAEKIRGDAVNILVDLSGHTGLNRLPVFAWRPAPVQATWMGYFASTGVPTIDYLMRDRYTSPEEFASHYTEQIWGMRASGCIAPPDYDVEVSPLPAESNGYVTYGSFHSLAKLTDDVVSTWSKIVKANEGSKLFLKCRELSGEIVIEKILERFESNGVARDRLIIEGFSPRKEYLEAYHRIDIALDTFPYNGGTTNLECLWMGVPFVAVKGDRMISNMGVAQLDKAGLSEWKADDLDDYVVKATQLSQDISALAQLRSGLRQKVLKSSMFDAKGMARDLEESFAGMWNKHISQK